MKMRARSWIGCGIAMLAVGCADSDVGVRQQALAIDGPWVPQADLVAQADGYDITFVGAGPWKGTSGCSGSFTEGGNVFRQWIYDNWPQVTHVGGYSCRPINGDSSTMSVHATGRALDVSIPLDGGEADNDLGDPVANWFLAHAQEIGIQSIIWDRWIWSTSRSPRSRAYTGAHPHHNHIHVELTPAASRLETPWFQGEMGPPEQTGCDAPLPAEGGVVDDADTCFQAFGPATYWRHVDGQGVGDSLRWTNAFETDTPSNWARWRLNLTEGGRYRVEYNAVREFAVFGSTHYAVKFGEQTEDIYLDLSAGGDGWQPLGEWEFAVGPEQWVAVYDDHAGPVEPDQHVLADAIRLVRLDGPSTAGEDGDVVSGEESAPPGLVDDDTPPGGPDGDGGLAGSGPRVIRGDGGCSTTAGAPPAWLGIVLLGFGFATRRQRARRRARPHCR